MIRLLAVLGAFAASGIASVVDSGGGRSSPAVDRQKLRQAERLIQRRVAPPGMSAAPQRARELTRSYGRVIPLPTGGNFNGVRWEAAAAPVPVAQLEAVLEYNAMCQWVRAQREGRDRGTADAMLARVLRWPQLSGVTITPQRVLDCYQSHAREVSFAERRHRRPSL